MLHICLIIVLALTGLRAEDEDMCSKGLNEVCFTEQMERLPLDDALSLPTKEQLDLICLVASSRSRCMRNFVETCKELDQYEFSETRGDLIDTLDVIEDLCDENSQLAQGYLENVECLNKALASSRDSCMVAHSEALDAYVDYVKSVTDRKRVAGHDRACSMFILMGSCLFTSAEETCGRQSLDPIMEVVERLKIDRRVCGDSVTAYLLSRFRSFLDTKPEVLESEKFSFLSHII